MGADSQVKSEGDMDMSNSLFFFVANFDQRDPVLVSRSCGGYAVL